MFRILTFNYCVLINPINVICESSWMCAAVCVSHTNSVRGGGRFQERRCDYREEKVIELLKERRDERQEEGRNEQNRRNGGRMK